MRHVASSADLSQLSASQRIADFILAAFLAVGILGGALFVLAALMFGAGAILDLIVHSISIVRAS